MDKIKTLSQAIRLGATFRPQGFGCYLEKRGTCAIGAALEAIGIDLKKAVPRAALKRFNLCDDNGHTSLWWTITSMNDKTMTREEIADWLESQGL